MTILKSIITIAAIGLLFTSCQSPEQIEELKKADLEKVMLGVEEQMLALTDSMDLVCEEMVDSLARVAIARTSRSGGSSSSGSVASSGKTSTSSSKTSTSQQTKKDKISGGAVEATKEDTEKKKDKLSGGKVEVTTGDTKKKKSKLKGGN